MIHTIRTVAHKELVETLRDGRFRWTAIALLAVLTVALITGLSNVRQTRVDVAAAEQSESSTWLGQGQRNPHSAAHFGRFAFKPTPAVAFLDPGLDPYLGSSVWLEAHWQNPFGLRPAEDRTALQRFGELSAAFVLQLLIPLFVVLLAFGAFTFEKENGTLRLLMAAGVSPWQLAIGKALGLSAALFCVLAPTAVLAAGLSLLGFPAADQADQMTRFAVLAALYLGYGLVFLALSLAVSARSRTSRTAITVLLGFWVLTTLVVPRLATDLAERLHPTPSPETFYSQIAALEKNGIGDDGTPAERRARLEQETLQRYDAASLDELPVDFAGISLQASEEYSNKVFDHVFGELWTTYRNQQRIHQAAGLVSPLLAARTVSMALAGTGLDSHRHFAVAAEQHRREFVEFLNDDLAHNSRGQGFSYLADREVWARTPQFDYREPSVGEVTRSRASALVLLGLWLAAGIALAWSSCRRLPLAVAR